MKPSTTSMKHTPGPWTVDRLYAALNGKATMEEGSLIAAAPYMIAALVAVQDWADEQRISIPVRCGVRTAISMVKTEGKVAR